MARALKAAFAYFVCVFALGFVLGAVRLLIVAPRVGEFAAVCLELPVILSASWVICRRLVLRFAVDAHLASRVTMGMAAFLLLMIVEFALATFLFRRTTIEYFSNLLTAAGLLGLFGQVLFAFFPLWQRKMIVS